MKSKKLLGLITLTAVVAVTLAACGGGKKSDSGNKNVETEDISKFAMKVKNDKEAIKGGTLEVAVASDTQFKGLFSKIYYQDAYDYHYMRPSDEGLFGYDEDFVITDDGAAKLDLDVDNKKATITLKENIKWSDGEPVTADDLIYPYEVIGNKDYTGIRYDDNFTNIVGMEEYHDGKADTISGIKKVDDQSIEVTYKEMNPGMLQLDGGVYTSAMPKHIFKDIPIKDQEKSDAVRKNPVTYGPYYMSKIVTGESVEYLPNEHYYKGKPKLDKIVFTNVPTASIVEAVKAKKYDMVYSMPTDNFPTYKDSEGYQMLGREELAYTYVGFKLGTFDKEKGEVIMNPDAKMADVKLRQAMGYAMDNDAIGQKFYNGLRTGATTLIPPIFKTLHNTDVKGYQYDLDKAKKILDDAGYKDTDGDGLRENPKGEKLTINFASMAGGETAQPLADYYLQQWKEIGLDVKLATGRLIDFQAFYDKIKNDDPEIDVFQAAWGVNSAPSPAGLYSRNAAFNYSRFASEENDKLLKAIDSKASFDDTKRKEAYDAWQEYMFEQAPVIPTLYRNEIMPVNDRVKSFTWNYEETKDFYDIELTSEKR
ncbi:peptide ABC transporter peptide-binding protein [Enterococcus moraviensis ATCC BAA-383]|uniref:Peptide ABC transporter peptide-binding protein n=1 Tax=Enterococcus moraviensis ATCC BAA-383 TaxID=1158609 RepID=R2QKJ9_9ENTE|nr:oligopeptide ABC transporter substrate-binding protein [Enterococcus moraviensis]EOH95708.1 peptide ABC transporter peptide-binding protein [Enterococcus moraviensis ATCC BAA-383]EOT66195.1 peptide ABC transporter peptide-binding protein [Enterococcus moraviensis ATCC BAA-383]OJG67740.1 peptide ABC transporter peptide-binding protein [Enterococcus moraviensis]